MERGEEGGDEARRAGGCSGDFAGSGGLEKRGWLATAGCLGMGGRG